MVMLNIVSITIIITNKNLLFLFISFIYFYLFKDYSP
ncbi:Uncharacterised protein [Segatella copri]|nr:Uncharacterised protein [Segatella copri]